MLELVDDEDHLGTFGSANPFCSLGQSEFRWQFGDSLVQLPQYPLLGLLRGRFDIDCDQTARGDLLLCGCGCLDRRRG